MTEVKLRAAITDLVDRAREPHLEASEVLQLTQAACNVTSVLATLRELDQEPGADPSSGSMASLEASRN